MVLGVRSQFRCDVIRWVFGVGSQFPCKAPEGRDEVEGNLCSDPENARVRVRSFFVWEELSTPFGLSLSKPRFPHPVGLRYRSLALDHSPGPSQSFGAALSPRRATHFLLLRQEKVSKEKATRSLGPCASLRAPCGARFERGHAQTRLRLKQVRALIRSKLRSSAQPERVGEWIRIRGTLNPLCGLNDAMFLVAAHACLIWVGGLKH